MFLGWATLSNKTQQNMLVGDVLNWQSKANGKGAQMKSRTEKSPAQRFCSLFYEPRLVVQNQGMSL